jgi:hypothetical protein
MALVLATQLNFTTRFLMQIWHYDAKIWVSNRIYDTPMQFKASMAMLVGVYILVFSKTAEDCFKCFSKVQNVKYSRFQYRRFAFTEKMIRARRRANLICQLENIHRNQESILMLHTVDHNLDTDEMLDANNLGLDMNFMVRYCAGEKMESAESDT